MYVIRGERVYNKKDISQNEIALVHHAGMLRVSEYAVLDHVCSNIHDQGHFY